jgi:carotenoid cleavage dioxygenase
MNGKSRIGVMPRFGDAESIIWFDVENHCSYHLFNCFEDGNEVIPIKSKMHANRYHRDKRESYDNKLSIGSNNILYQGCSCFSVLCTLTKKM